ncbi:MAG: hypothetical protein JXM70_05745 [Pirellulales bacterium]|nr:hypothetical protein [Pirellulales bacterium]
MSGVLLLAGCLMVAAPDDTTSPEQLALDVRKLARQLDAPRLADRQKAEADLIELGPQALELLPKIDSRTSAETKQRLARIRRKLQEAQAQEAASPSTVTLKGESMPLSEFLAAVEKQTGNKILDLREKFGQAKTDPKLKINLDKVPFWKALDQVLDQAGMTVYPYASERAVGIIAKSGKDTRRQDHTVYTGPFRIEPVTIIATRELRDTGRQSMKIKLEVSWEPRLAPISLRQNLADIRAVDENGRALTVDNRHGGEIDAQVNRDETTIEMYLPMALPPRDVRKIATLDGRLDAVLPGKTTTFRFDKLSQAKGVEKRVAGVTVTLDHARKDESVWEIAVSIRFDEAGEALESHRDWIFNNEAYLETPDGKRIKDDGIETTHQSKNEVGIKYLFVLEKPPTGMTFVYKTPADILSTGFEYKIKDIPLP